MERGTGLKDALRQRALELGADFFGVADLSAGRELVREQGGEMLAQFDRALSVGVVMPFAIVDQLPRHREKAVAVAYRSHSYDILNIRLDQIASHLASQLQRSGHRAFPVRASQHVDESRLFGLISHKLAANLAGLGWIGKSCLLITPEVGPRVRWATVLTDAPLEAGRPVEERCGQCRQCVDACPVQAFKNRNFRADEPREARYEAFKCRDYLHRDDDVLGAEIAICGMCVYSCPYGQKGHPRG
jgi:epoxyqueuosine reductase